MQDLKNSALLQIQLLLIQIGPLPSTKALHAGAKL